MSNGGYRPLEFRLIIVGLKLAEGEWEHYLNSVKPISHKHCNDFLVTFPESMLLIKRSQDFGRSLNNATLTQTHQKRQIISITYSMMAKAYIMFWF